VRGAQLGELEQRQIQEVIGVVGGALEADVGLIAQIGRAPVGPLQKITALLRLASGEAAPLGPAANRAKTEAIKMLRAPEIRTSLDAAPDSAASLRSLMQSAGIAA
jgi:hypothetical protein